MKYLIAILLLISCSHKRYVERVLIINDDTISLVNCEHIDILKLRNFTISRHWKDSTTGADTVFLQTSPHWYQRLYGAYSKDSPMHYWNSGDKTEEIIARFPEVDSSHPKGIIIEPMWNDTSIIGHSVCFDTVRPEPKWLGRLFKNSKHKEINCGKH